MKEIVNKLEEIRNEFIEMLKNRKDDSVKSLQEVSTKLQNEINRRRDSFYEKKQLVKQARSKEIKVEHKKHFISAWVSLHSLKFKYIISWPFIYSMIIPAIILDIFLEIYHRICFPLYWIPLVKRSEYFVYDRRFLSYLNWFEKLNCFYCSYFNNLIGYTREIAWRTERFWCPIKHAKRVPDPHSYYEDFADYLDASDFRTKLNDEKCFNKLKERNINN